MLLGLIGIGIMIRYAFHDIDLNVDLLREGLERMPGLVMENLAFEREISGDLWQVNIPLAERNGDLVRVHSVDVHRWLSDGKEWYLRGDHGTYYVKGGDARLFRLLGTLETGTRVLNLESPTLSWSQNTNEFLFPKGFTIYDSEFILKTDLASVDENGLIQLDRGGTIRWTNNTD